MKTNIYTNMLVAGAFALALASCVDDNDWGTDSSYSRPFSPHDISVSAEATTATVEFDRLSSVDYYLLELSQDSLYEDDYHDNSRIDTVRVSPYMLDGLSGETVYFIRLKAVSSSTAVTDSKWSYYEDGVKRSFETKGEQILQSIIPADRTESSVRLSWAAGEAVTHIVVSVVGDESGEPETVTLTDTHIREGVCVVDGLNPTTTYLFVIYNGTSKRGERTATTAAAMPDGDLKYTLEDGITEITNALVQELVEQAQTATEKTSVGVTIGIPAGVSLELYGELAETEKTTLVIPDGVSVTFFGLAGAEKPVLNFSKTLEIGGNHGYIRFENVEIRDAGSSYLINQSSAMQVEEISFKDCEIPDLSRSLVRLQGSAAKTIGTLNIDNCVVSNQGSGGYAFLYWNNAAHTVSNVNITNSTFNTMLHSFADIRNSATGAFNISNCTFYNVLGAGRYILDARTGVNVTVQSTIFGKTYADGVNGIRITGTTPRIIDVYKTSDCNIGSYNFTADRGETPVSSSELFANPDEGNFTVLENGLKSLGDPRWNNE